MSRTRTIYNVENLFAGPAPATGFSFASAPSFAANWNASTISNLTGDSNVGINLVNQLFRVQKCDYSFSVPRQSIFQYGELGELEKLILDTPTVTLSFDYLISTFVNEKNLGFQIAAPSQIVGTQQNGAINNFLVQNAAGVTQEERNYYIATLPPGQDQNDKVYIGGTSGFVLGIGNAFINNYSVSAAVGGFPKASVTAEGLNMSWQNYSFNQSTPFPVVGGAVVTSGQAILPAIDPINGNVSTRTFAIPQAYSNPTGTATTYSVIRPGDITLSLSTDEGGAFSDAKIQSFSLAIPLSRTNLEKLGSKYAYSREINFPITETFSFSAIVGDLTTGRLTEIVKNNTPYNITVAMNQPGTTTQAIAYIVSGAYLDGESFTSSIGANKQVTYNFSMSAGQNGGIYFSGLC